VQLRRFSLKELQSNAKLTVVSSTSIIEGAAHDVIVKDAKAKGKLINSHNIRD
jgi:hypothetical protein